MSMGRIPDICSASSLPKSSTMRHVVVNLPMVLESLLTTQKLNRSLDFMVTLLAAELGTVCNNVGL